MKATKINIISLVLFFGCLLNLSLSRNASAATLSPAQIATCGSFYKGQLGANAGAPEYCFPQFVKEFVRGTNYESASQTFAQKLTGECCHHPTTDNRRAFYRHSIAWVSRPGSNPWDAVVVTTAEMAESRWVQLDLWSVRYSCDTVIDAPSNVCKPLESGSVQIQKTKNNFHLFMTNRPEMGWVSEQYHLTYPKNNNNFVKIFYEPFKTGANCGNVSSMVGAGMERFIKIEPIGTYGTYSRPEDNIVNYPKITQGINSQLRTFTDFYGTGQPNKKVIINPRQLYEVCKDSSAKGCELVKEDLVNGDLYKIFMGGLSGVLASHDSCSSSGPLTGNADVDALLHSRCENSSTQPLYLRVKRPQIINPAVYANSTIQKNSVPPVVKNSDISPMIGASGPGVEISTNDTANFSHVVTITYSGDFQKETLVRYKIDNIGADGKPTENISNPAAGSANYQVVPVPSDSNPARITIVEKHKASIADRNKVFCRRISYQYIDQLGKVLKSDMLSPICTKVTFNYKLTPVVINSAISASPGDVITTSPKVELTNDPEVESNWKLTQMVFSPTNLVNYSKLPVGQLANNLEPITHFNSFGPSGSTTLVASGKELFTQLVTLLGDRQSVLNYPIGTRICFALSLSPWSSGSSWNWVHSAPACVAITKQPNAQIHGGALKVPNGKVVGTTGIRGIATRTFGSWVEYDILAKGLVTNTASNAGYLTFTGLIGDLRQLNLLTFSNDVPSALGKFSDSMPKNEAETVAKYFKGGKKGEPSPLILDLATWINNSVVPNIIGHKNYDGGNLTITGTNPIVIPWGKSAVVVVENGDLIINQNINYQDSAKSIRDLPQLVFVVLNGNIKIDESVTKIDAWLIATGSNSTKGRLVTCNLPKGSIKLSNCNKQLVINGPVVVDYIDLFRTAGMEQNDVSDTAAEIINFRPDAYLWSQKNQAEGNLILSTTYLRELPPRY